MKMLSILMTLMLLGGCAASEETTGAGGSADTGGNNTGGGDTGGGTGSYGDTLSQRYPRDEGMAEDPAVLFFDDFEAGWGRWDWPRRDTDYLTLENDATQAHAGSHYLRSSVSEADLEADSDTYISSSTGKTFDEQSNVMYVRFYARRVGVSPKPGHWVRFAAKSDSWDSSGLANTVPPGDGGFWFDLDITRDDAGNEDFMFYAYWHQMRSGRCNDGSTTPGCTGDQGTTYYYGNVFRPADQAPIERDRWVCIEVMAKANTVGDSDGELALWVDDDPVEHYRKGSPMGSWLRAKFYAPGTCSWPSCPDPSPFEGFNFRSSEQVRFGQFFLDAYNELASFRRDLERLRNLGMNPSTTQTILYDDVVVAKERIGCRVE